MAINNLNAGITNNYYPLPSLIERLCRNKRCSGFSLWWLLLYSYVV